MQGNKNVEKNGPYGPKDGKNNWSMLLNTSEIISEVIVKSGSIIDSIAFTTVKPSPCGCRWSATHRKFGGNGGGCTNKMTLKCGEYITHISGETGKWNNQHLVAKLTVHTNLRPDGYGTYGHGMGTNKLSKFVTPIPSGGRVVGFFGTHNNYLQSIGVYGKKKQKFEKDGPYGSQLAENWCMKLGEDELIKEVIIRHKFVVHGFGLVVAKPCGLVTTIMLGGKGGDESKITLKNGEYITHISGIYGDYGELIEQRIIAMVKIHTNLCPTGYGPFGNAYNVDNVGIFLSPPSPFRRQVVGFFGRHGDYLESIGTRLEKVTSKFWNDRDDLSIFEITTLWQV